MPWSVADVDSHRKGLSKSQKKAWVKIANGALKTCLAENGTDKSCAGRAVRIANSHFEKSGKRIK